MNNMSNEERYRRDINQCNPDYKITITDFERILREKELADIFHRMLRDKEESLFDIALDFSIPIAMVKYFRQSA